MSDTEKLLTRYEGNRVIRPLIQLILPGIGSALDIVLIQTLDKIRYERARAFFDELAKGNLISDKVLLKSEDFLHCYITTIQSALKTRSREKIRMFARLLKSSPDDSGPADIDEYEYFLNILDNLSFKEIQALTILDRFSDSFRDGTGSDPSWNLTFWEKFETKLSEQLNIPRERTADFMIGIVRTGCYEIFTDAQIRYTAGQGKLTPTFKRLKEFILESEIDT